jgi:hypothetical protein
MASAAGGRAEQNGKFDSGRMMLTTSSLSLLDDLQ